MIISKSSGSNNSLVIVEKILLNLSILPKGKFSPSRCVHVGHIILIFFLKFLSFWYFYCCCEFKLRKNLRYFLRFKVNIKPMGWRNLVCFGYVLININMNISTASPALVYNASVHWELLLKGIFSFFTASLHERECKCLSQTKALQMLLKIYF